MHRFTLTVSILSLLISFSCNHYSRHEKADHENLVICCYDTIDKHHPTVSIDDISYIPLETNDRSLIGSINKIIYRNQRFYIFDRMNMKIFIFDDSFSALDLKTDAALRKALAENVKDSTVIIVAQRISTILNADKIIVLDDGHMAGIGTHKELMKNCEVYRQIAMSQLSEEELA